MPFGFSIYNMVSFPLLARETRVLLRSNKAFLAMLVFDAILMVVVVQQWSVFSSYWDPGRDVAEGAKQFFYWITMGHLGFLTLFTPFVMAPSIAREHEQETLTLLLSSPVTSLQIIMVKWLTPMLYMVLILTAAMPFLALVFLGGGLSMTEVFMAYLVMLFATFMYGSMGMFCSTLRPRVYEVYLLSIAAMLLIALFLPYHGSIWHYISTLRWQGVGTLNHDLQYLSPFFVLSELIYPTTQFAQTKITLDNPFAGLGLGGPGIVLNKVQTMFMVVTSAVTLGFLTLATLRVHRLTLGNESLPSLPEEELEEEDDEDEFGLMDRDYMISFDDSQATRNPGLALERRIQWFARLPVLFRLFYISLIISVLTLPLASYNGSWLFLSLPFIASAFFTLPLAATCISSDRERGTLDLVRTSLLSSRQIVSAKFTTNMQYSFFLALALYLPGMLIQLIFALFLNWEVDLVTSTSDVFAILFYPFILFSALMLYTGLGLFLSAAISRTNQAMLISGLLIFITLITPFLLPPIGWSQGFLPGLLYIGFLFMSPLTGVSILFPAGSVRLLDDSLSAIQATGWQAFSFAIAQCIVCVIGAVYLVYQAEKALDRT